MGEVYNAKDLTGIDSALGQIIRRMEDLAQTNTRNSLKLPHLKQFSGNAEQLQEFEMKFRIYVRFAPITDQEACELLGLYLAEDAARWFYNHPGCEKGNLDQLFNGLNNRFNPEQRKILLTQEAMDL